MAIALDATYSIGAELSGVGIYSREILWGLPSACPEQQFRFLYRPHRLMRSLRETLPRNCNRAVFDDHWMLPARTDLFHGLNQRMPAFRLRRSVSTFHDLFVLTNGYSTPEFRDRFTRQARQAAERSDLIITVSAFTASQVESLLHVEKARLRVIHHGIRSLPRVGISDREPLILHVGAIQLRKNLTRLVAAFERTREPWRLVLAGSPSGYGSEQVLSAIAKSPARNRIIVTGYVASTELSALYARASVFAFPSLDEGFGMPVLEAMSRGIAVLTSNRSALPEVAADAALLVDPTSIESIAEGLRRLTDDEECRSVFARRGLRRSRDFTWDRTVEKTLNVYRELM